MDAMAMPPVILQGAAGPAFAGPGAPHWFDIVTQWRVDPLTLALLVAAGAGYAWYRVRARRAGIGWPASRDMVVAAGIIAAIWATSGVAEVRATQLEWVWMAQLLVLLLVLPLVILAGRPVQLVTEVSGGHALIGRVVASRPVRMLSNPLVGPALVPVTFLVLLYGGVGQAAASSAPVGWLLHAVLLLLGAAIALPLVDASDARSSLAVGMALGVGFLELILDVFPGIALRLADHPLIGFFASHTPPWAGGWLYQQHQAGGLLWIALEVLDLPFLVFLAVRWLRVDTAEAARMDAMLDAQGAPAVTESAAAGAPASGAVVTGSVGAARSREPGDAPAGPAGRRGAASPAADRPWFLDDPQLRDRYRF